MIPKLNPELFELSLWRNGSILDVIGLPLRSSTREFISSRIKRDVVGYCDGEFLVVRPKPQTKAVMFFKNGYHFWFHLSNDEFSLMFE